MQNEFSTTSHIVVELRSYSREAEAEAFAKENSFPLEENFGSSSIGQELENGTKQRKINKSYFNKKKVKNDQSTYRIVFDTNQVSLITPSCDIIFTDFVAGELAHRRKFGGGKGQMIAKAVGLNKGCFPKVLDATAGLGGDAFVLACLGCEVTMIERSAVARLLLQSGLQQAKFVLSESPDSELSAIVNRMSLISGDSLTLLEREKFESLELSEPEVIYLDPMFPAKKKSAEVKKGMKAFHELIGADGDASGLLTKALNLARYRVVVKRPRIAPFLADQEPSYQLVGKSSRFDIYAKKAFPNPKQYVDH